MTVNVIRDSSLKVRVSCRYCGGTGNLYREGCPVCEQAMVEAARRSGMAEVAQALDAWWTQRTITMQRKGRADG